MRGSRRHFVVALVVWAAASAGRCLPDAAPARAGEPPAGGDPTFSVATYNINWGNVDLRKTAATIRKAAADLVLLQETNVQSESYLRGQLRGTYRYMVFRGDRGQYAAERFGFVSKSPVTNLRFLRPKHGLFGAWIGETVVAGRKLQVANVHLEPAMLSREMGLTGALAALSKMEKTHAQEIEYLYKNLAADVPTLVGGDFNSLAEFAAPKFLLGKAFIDSFASVTEQPDNHRTWHWPVGRTELSARIDYLFHTRHLRTVESRTVEADSSDHLLVVSRLQWQAGEQAGPAPAERAGE